MRLARIALLSLACVAPLAARAGVEVSVSGPEVIVRAEPPALRAEVVPVAPGPGFIWIRGHWGWHRDRWIWVGGRWDHVGRPGSAWVPGRWVVRGGGWVWFEGHYAAIAAPPRAAAGAAVEVMADEEPPAPIVETIPVAPAPDFFWVGGHWHWNGGWVWVRGRFVRHPHFHPGGHWEPGHWDRRGAHWVWHDGHWR